MKTPEEIIIWCDMMLNHHPNIEDTNFFNSIKDYMKEQRPKGEWIHRRVIAKNRSFDMVVCSNCWEEFSWDAETGVCMDNYKTCPNCAADMRKNNNVPQKYNSSINITMEDIMSDPKLYKHWKETSE